MDKQAKDDGIEVCDLIARWIKVVKVACGKGDLEACDELKRALQQYEDELYAVYGGD